MAQDSIHKIITIEIEYSKLIKGWAEAQKVIDETQIGRASCRERV